MTTVRGNLVAGRVRIFEEVTPLKFCSYSPHTVQLNLQSTSKNNRRQKSTLRPAPSVPTSAPATAATAEAAALLPPHQNAATKDFHKEMPCFVSPPEATYELGEFPPTPSSQAPWSKSRDHCSSLGSRFEKTLPTKRGEFKLGLLLLICLGCLLFLVVLARWGSHHTELDEYFHHLNYSPDQLLVYQGETIETVPGREILDQNSCIVMERTKQSVSNGNAEVGVVASNEHRTFPGALLLANSHLVDNSPDVLAVGRAPLTYTVNLPGLTTDGSFTIVPSFSKYQAALNEVLNTWFQNYSNIYSTAANLQSVESFAYSKELLRVKFGVEFMNSIIEAGIDFNAMEKGEKLIKIYKFTQVFYSVSVEPNNRPSDLFDSSVTLSEIKRKTNEDNPPVLVDSVSYGRKIYVKLETSKIGVGLEAKLNLPFLKPGIEIAHDQEDINIQLFVFGGNNNHTELINVNNVNEVQGIITKFNMLSNDNLGSPLSYSSQFIKDNKKAIVNLSTDYVESVRNDNC